MTAPDVSLDALAEAVRESLIHGPPYAASDDPTALDALAALLARAKEAERQRDNWRACFFSEEAARLDEEDRVEDAEREVERWHREALDWQQAKSEADDETEAAEAKLAAAEKALERIAQPPACSDGCYMLARAALASIRSDGEQGGQG